MWEELYQWFSQPVVMWSATSVSIAIIVIGFLAVPRLAIRLPVDYFIRQTPRRRETKSFALLRVVWLISRNVLGLVLFVAGVLMLILPGPGIISIMIAVAVADFPGKHHVEQWLIHNWIVRKALNAMRKKHGVPPFLVADDNASAEPGKQ